MASLSRRSFLSLTAGIPLGAALPGLDAAARASAAGPGASAAAASGSAAGGSAAAVAPRGHLIGLLARQPQQVTDGNAARLTGFVQRLSWAEAQPTPGGGLSATATARLAAAVTQARQRGYPRLKLRLEAGIDAPAWAKQLGGGPLAGWQEPENGGTGDVPKWWEGAYLDAYAEFVALLAPVLAADPEWSEVTVSATCTFFAEPCIKQFGVAANRATALAAGYTAAADEAALRRAMADQAAVLRPYGILSSVAWNPWQSITAQGRLGVSTATTIALMDHQRQVMGDSGVWANNSLIGGRAGGELVQLRPEYAELYAHMTGGVYPFQFQTATLAKITAEGGTVLDTAAWAAETGGLSVELPLNWDRDGHPDAAEAAALNQRMAQNDT